MRSSEVAVLLVVATAGLVSHGLGQDEQCVATLQAPEDSPWRAMGVAPIKISLSKATRFADKHGLKLEKGPPSPLDFQARVTLACEHLGEMRMALPSAAEDDSNFGCWLDNFRENFFKFIGKLKKIPDQYLDSPLRVYMENFCGKELPVAPPAGDTGSSMTRNTRYMNKKLKRILKKYREKIKITHIFTQKKT